MRTTQHGRRKKHPSRQVLDTAISVLTLGAGLFIGSIVLKSANPMLQALSNGMRIPVPYLLFFGLVLLVLYAVLRPKADAGSAPKDPSTMFGKDTTDFASQLDRPSGSATLQVQHRGQRPPATAWSARVFEDIEWRRFEALCEALFGQAGFETRAQSHGADGGVDIWLHSRHSEGPAAVVQCKHWQGKAVGVKEMREFYGVMASHKLQRGTFATSSTFTPEAQKFATDNGISALDGQGLLALIATRTPEQQQALLATAYQGEYWRPTCASCGTKMAERTSRAKKNAFWGCVNYPRCTFTLPVRA